MLDGLEWAALLAIVIIIAGGKKLPELGSGLGKGISEFKKALGADTKQQEETKAVSGAEAKTADATNPNESK
ncbi:MAG: twin-arginine translocase TatA/TatE family subunit [Syntrophobacteraceae bacterium]|nr:twin-arginine translocase TatA/TatE family subunit [Syntrophobacteraceae bacterium]